MRILHVVTYLSPDRAFGGPVTVALQQCRALVEMGHEVDLVAAAPVNHPEVESVDGISVHRFPARWRLRRMGFATMASPGLWSYLRTIDTPDVAHVHFARDLVSLPAAAILQSRGVPVFLQPHGMVDSPSNALALILDSLVLKRVMKRSVGVFVITEHERREIAAVAPSAATLQIPNGISLERPPLPARREPVVLFMARLHPRKRVLAFVEMAEKVAATHPEVRFRIAGADEGEGKALRVAVEGSPLRDRFAILGALTPERARDEMLNARIYVLPSVNEVFPMTMLEAFVCETAVIATDSLGIADECRLFDAASICAPDAGSLAQAAIQLLEDDNRRDMITNGAIRYVRERLSIDRVAGMLVDAYSSHLVR